MVSKCKRPAGITAISTFLVTLGALVCGAAFVALCTDIPTLLSAAGFRYETVMLAMIFAGGSFAGFGIGLYEGYGWARPASLGALAFVATLQVFGLAAHEIPRAMPCEEALLLMAAGSVLYLAMPAGRRFFSPYRRQTVTVNVEEPVAVIRRAS